MPLVYMCDHLGPVIPLSSKYFHVLVLYHTHVLFELSLKQIVTLLFQSFVQSFLNFLIIDDIFS